MDYKNNVLGRLLNGFSQFGHTLALGNPDISMSAKTGWKSLKGYKWFMIMEKIIDFTFYPVDGKNHCYTAYNSDVKENYALDVPYITDVLISIFQLLGCAVLIVPFWIFKLIKWKF